MLTLRDTENDDEVDAVKILLNALYSSAPAEQSLIPHNETSKNYKSRVTFQQSDLRDTSIHQLQLKASTKPPIIPNAPINKDHQTLLDTLAELACSKSPVRVRLTNNGEDGWKSRRPRAMSEPWLVEQPLAPLNAGYAAGSIITDDTATRRHFATPTTSFPPLSPPSLSASAPAVSASSLTDQNFAATAADVTCYSMFVLPLGMAAWASRKMNDAACPSMPTSSSSNPSSSSSSVTLSHSNYGILPQLLDGDYSTLCNKNGRIGIYTKEERMSIISRFQDKRKNRVWKKKIRYHCRKNLADRRVRIKGRFVRAVDGSLPLEERFHTERDRGMEVGVDVETKRDPDVDADADRLTSLEVGERVGREMHKMDIIDSTSCRAFPFESDEISPNIRHSGAKFRCRQLPSESRGTGTTCTPVPMGSALEGMKAFWGAVLDSSAPAHSSASDDQDRASDGRTDAVATCIRHPEAIRSKITPGEVEETRAHDDDDDDDGSEVMSSGEEGSSAGASKRFRRHTIAY